MSGKAITIGSVGQGFSSNIGLHLENAREANQEHLKSKLANRHALLSKLATEFDLAGELKTFAAITSRESKANGKDFVMLNRYVEGMNLASYAKTGRAPAATHLAKINLTLKALLNSAAFAKASLEDITTPYFKLCFALYLSLKTFVDQIKGKNSIDPRQYKALVMFASDIGVRLYSQYTDVRLDDVDNLVKAYAE